MVAWARETRKRQACYAVNQQADTVETGAAWACAEMPEAEIAAIVDRLLVQSILKCCSQILQILQEIYGQGTPFACWIEPPARAGTDAFFGVADPSV